MPTYRDEGVVLRTIKLGEADRIITILTKNHGKIRAVARGVRRTKSRFGARLEPFMRDDLLIAEGHRDLDTISQAVSISPYARAIASRYDAYIAANVMAETADKLITEDFESTSQEYSLLISALASLARGEHRSELIEYSYILRAISLAGWTPRVDACVVCGRQTDLEYFSAQAGGIMCSTDRDSRSRRISHEAAVQLAALVNGTWNVLDDIPLDSEVGDIVEEWSQYYIERPIRSMRLIDSNHEF